MRSGMDWTGGMSRCFCAAFFATFAFQSVPQRCEGQVLVTSSSKDNTLYESATGNLSNGAGSGMFVGATGTGTLRRALIAFDLSSIPANALVTEVSLTLFMSRSGSGAETVTLNRLGRDWGQGASDAAGQEGGGTIAQSGDATWTHAFYNTTSWSTPGGDFVATPSASSSVGGIGFYTWNSTPRLVADVQDWINNRASNFGWAILGNESEAGSAKRFATRENGTVANRPALRVAYTVVPGPPALPLFTAAMALAAARVRRKQPKRPNQAS